MTTNMNKALTFRPLKIILSIAVLSLLSMSLRTLEPQNRLHAPSARMAIQDPVPLSYVEKIAATKAKQVWGEGALGKPIPLCNPDGDLIAWMFSYCIGSTTFPAYEELLQQIKMGRELVNLVERSELSEAKQLYQSLLACDSRRTFISSTPISPKGARLAQIEPVRADGTSSRIAQVAETRELRKYGEDKAIGAGEFGTIVVSATYRNVPVPVYLHYLSPYYINFDQALEKASALIGGGASLERIYFLRLRGLFFEFVNNGYAIVLHAETLEPANIASGMRSLKRVMPEGPAIAAARMQINRLWTEIQQEIR